MTDETVVVIETPGAGGYGDPGERTAEATREDLVSGKFTETFVAENYVSEKVA